MAERKKKKTKLKKAAPSFIRAQRAETRRKALEPLRGFETVLKVKLKPKKKPAPKRKKRK